MTLTLVLGGARSGKTRYALAAATESASGKGGRLTMIATAEALDDEMTARIARHRAERGAAWSTVEAPLAVTESVAALEPGDVAVIDCLTLWISNLMHHERDITAAVAELVAACRVSPADIFIVSNEVGQGIVPDNALARRFRDEAGWANQAMAKAADVAILVVAGLPLRLKG